MNSWTVELTFFVVTRYSNPWLVRPVHRYLLVNVFPNVMKVHVACNISPSEWVCEGVKCVVSVTILTVLLAEVCNWLRLKTERCSLVIRIYILNEGLLICNNVNEFEIIDNCVVVPTFRNASVCRMVSGKAYLVVFRHTLGTLDRSQMFFSSKCGLSALSTDPPPFSPRSQFNEYHELISSEQSGRGECGISPPSRMRGAIPHLPCFCSGHGVLLSKGTALH
jgi:hypothetical protein